MHFFVYTVHLFGKGKFAFLTLKTQAKHDFAKYDVIVERRREAGKKGGFKKAENRKQNLANVANANNFSKCKQNVANLANLANNDNDNVNDNDNDNYNGLGSSRGSGGAYVVEDEFNIYKKMTPQDVDIIYESYPNSGGDLIQAVYEDVKKKKKKVTSPVPYILGYADKVLWDDNADHGGAS